ncbi:hypothetical protein CXB51_025580 [Gossypium anomalum]|uniref:JAB1/MPN/MOV34 metalloenzyme domain-containing protein n=1 Tax=Gossypium anomalum TaxID=47600 RepID=A0A8J6CQG4_9ROSI|nr:hypothetical protein CXB51_025580 [Gossypium anomalum]
MKLDVNAMARRVEVDNRIPLRYYYRIADSLLKQVLNLSPLFSGEHLSLVSETIPFHRDYQVLLPKEKAVYRKRLLAVLDELESLKPEVQQRVEELNKARTGARLVDLDDHEGPFHGSDKMSPSDWNPENRRLNMSLDIKQPANMEVQSSWKYKTITIIRLTGSFRSCEFLLFLSLNIPLPNKETLSRHSFLGPNGFHGQWLGPSAEIKVQYPSNKDLAPAENSSLNQAGQYGPLAVKDGEPGGVGSAMDSVLSLDDGRWLHPAEESYTSLTSEANQDLFQFVGMKQPSPPPVIAQVQPEFTPIHPSKVADPRPGPAKSSQDGLPNSSSFQHLHVPVQMMEDFLRLARANTEKNLETCGVLAGSLKNRVFHITTLIIPKQESTSDSKELTTSMYILAICLYPCALCSTLNEEEIFEVQDKLSLFLWDGFIRTQLRLVSCHQLIFTHITRTRLCYRKQLQLLWPQLTRPEAYYVFKSSFCLVAESEKDGIILIPCILKQLPTWYLSSVRSWWVSIIRNCQQRGFHPHEEPSDGTPIYEHCSHVFMNPKIKFDVVDLR